MGYRPEQPVSFSHALHVRQLGMDCRFCHSSVEVAARADLPATQTCISCHGKGRILSKSPRLVPVLESWNSGLPIRWVRVHSLPDYVYFHHAAHVRRGVSCMSCHGNVGWMEVTQVRKPLTMAWCLQCHREPEKFLRLPERGGDSCPFPMGEGGVGGGKSGSGMQPPVSCGGCHR